MDTRRKRSGGVSANKVVVPIIVVLAVLHVLIISLIFSINTQSSELSSTMQDSGTYIEDATSLLAGSSLLSETASNFVLLPVTQTGEVNIGPLQAYANELSVERRGDQILERFYGYQVSEDAMDKLSEAAECANNMMEAQLHAMALVTSIYPIPDISPLNTIPIPALSEEEQTMTEDQKLASARLLVLGSEYALNKQSVSQNVGACTGAIKAEMSEKAAGTARNIAILRHCLWVVTIAIIILLAIAFVVIYREMILPLVDFVRLISTDHILNEEEGLAEVRMLASSYNALMRRRDALDGILRSAAETDVLTNLPNRYRFEQQLVEMKESDGTMMVMLFDVNYLKRTNDTLGHAAGDKLLQSATMSIASCFGNDGDQSNCYRIGGDEFAAILRNVDSAQLQEKIRNFTEMQKNQNISISWGNAYAADIREANFKELIRQADEEMYEQKRKIHNEEDPSYRPSHVWVADDDESK